MAKTLHSPEQDALVALLREAREKAGLRQVDLANRLGQPQSLISKIESGERRVDLVELRGICAALGVDLVKFVRRFDQIAR